MNFDKESKTEKIRRGGGLGGRGGGWEGGGGLKGVSSVGK